MEQIGKQRRPRSDATENKGMKLIWGNAFSRSSSENIRFFIKANIGVFTDIPVPASVAQLDVPSDWRPGGREFNPCRGRQHYFVEIDHEIFSTVILSLPLIQEGQLSVSGEKMCTILVNRSED